MQYDELSGQEVGCLLMLQLIEVCNTEGKYRLVATMHTKYI